MSPGVRRSRPTCCQSRPAVNTCCVTLVLVVSCRPTKRHRLVRQRKEKAARLADDDAQRYAVTTFLSLWPTTKATRTTLQCQNCLVLLCQVGWFTSVSTPTTCRGEGVGVGGGGGCFLFCPNRRRTVQFEVLNAGCVITPQQAVSQCPWCAPPPPHLLSESASSKHLLCHSLPQVGTLQPQNKISDDEVQIFCRCK